MNKNCEPFCSSMYEDIVQNPEYSIEALPLMVPIAFLFGTQVPCHYSHSSEERVKSLYKQEACKVKEELTKRPAVLTAIQSGYSTSIYILDGHTRARYLPQANGINALPSLVFRPETIVNYLNRDGSSSLTASEYTRQIVDRSNAVIEAFEMCMGPRYQRPQSFTGMSRFVDLTEVPHLSVFETSIPTRMQRA